MTDPIRKFLRWYREAERAGVNLKESMALATANAIGKPSVRFVLLKDVNDDGFVFYTNSRSRKGEELSENPRAAFAFYWDEIGKQFRCEGRAVQVTKREADLYWHSRPWESQVAAAASSQSKPLPSRRKLLDRVKDLEREYNGKRLPRPDEWTGFRIRPQRMEFWTRQEPRLHIRELYRKSRGIWIREILQP